MNIFDNITAYESAQEVCKTENNAKFATVFSEYLNGGSGNMDAAVWLATREHRYLQNECFKFCKKFIIEMAKNFQKGWYDPRNEGACRQADMIMQHLSAMDEWYDWDYEKLTKVPQTTTY